MSVNLLKLTETYQLSFCVLLLSMALMAQKILMYETSNSTAMGVYCMKLVIDPVLTAFSSSKRLHTLSSSEQDTTG